MIVTTLNVTPLGVWKPVFKHIWKLCRAAACNGNCRECYIYQRMTRST